MTDDQKEKRNLNNEQSLLYRINKTILNHLWSL